MEAIISGLVEGDTLVAVEDDPSLDKSKTYKIKVDSDGDKYINTNKFGKRYLTLGGIIGGSAYRLVVRGVLKIEKNEGIRAVSGLSAGDILKSCVSSGNLTSRDTYKVLLDSEDDLYIRDDSGLRRFITLGGTPKGSGYELIVEGKLKVVDKTPDPEELTAYELGVKQGERNVKLADIEVRLSAIVAELKELRDA